MKEAIFSNLGAKTVSVILAFAVWYLIKSRDTQASEQLAPALQNILPTGN